MTRNKSSFFSFSTFVIVPYIYTPLDPFMNYWGVIFSVYWYWTINFSSQETNVKQSSKGLIVFTSFSHGTSAHSLRTRFDQISNRVGKVSQTLILHLWKAYLLCMSSWCWQALGTANCPRQSKITSLRHLQMHLIQHPGALEQSAK